MTQDTQGAGLTPLGKVLSFLLILGLIGVGVGVIYMKYAKAQHPGTTGASGTGAGGAGVNVESAAKVEAADTAGVLTRKDYTYIPAQKLPEVKGASAYKWDPKEKILRFSYNVWSGWLPIIAANHGTKPNDDSVFAKKYGFR